jgi:cytochrome d ubiquinol oxidase subunit I
MAANSWMQNPVGYTVNPATGRAQLTSIGAVLANPVFLRSILHVLLASLITAAVVMLAVSAWHLRRGSEAEAFTRSARVAIAVLAPAVALNLLIGSELGVTEGVYQPMKIAAAEAQWETCQPCSFSMFQIGGGNNDQTPSKIIQVPHLLSVLATNSWNGQVVGLNELQAQYVQQYGPGYYVPNVFVQYWSMRGMAYLGSLLLVVALWGLWRRRRLGESPWFLRVAIWCLPLPFLVNTAGWLLTENGRQPWIVQGLQKTQDAASPSVGLAAIATSLMIFLVLYAALAVVDWALMARYARKELPSEPAAEDAGTPVVAPSY